MVLFVQSSIEELEFFLAEQNGSAGCCGFAVSLEHAVGAAMEERCM